MKRTNIQGALLIAPIILASSLFTSVAHADPGQITALQLDAICSNASTNQGVFQAQNKNDFPIEIDFTSAATGQSGSYISPANSFDYFATYYDGNPLDNNQTLFTAEGWTSPVYTNVHTDLQCSSDILASLPTAGTTTTTTTTGSSTGSGGTTTSTGSGTSTTTTAPSTSTGGTGGGITNPTTTPMTATASQPVAVTAAPTLADTGASEIVPYSLACLLAVATLGTSFAVRKNIL
jgi:hypothetical protein